MNSIKQILNQTHLEQPDIAKYVAKQWLLFVLNKPYAFLISHDDYKLSLDEYQRYQQGIDKLASGIPLAYITGEQAFYGRDFIVNKHTLIPRADTELIVEIALDIITKADKAKPAILELGTGTGCIAISLAKHLSSAIITACDISPDALSVAKQNAKRHLASVHFVLSDWFDHIHGSFDMIISNPPYIKANDEHLAKLAHEPIHALVSGTDGLDAIKAIITQSHRYLCTGGYLLLEHGYHQKQDVQQLLQQHGYDDIHTHQDYGKQDRVTVACHAQTTI